MRLGALRHRVRLERPVQGAQDAAGTPAVRWETAGDAYAQVEPLYGREALVAKQVDGRVTHRVTLRYRPGLSTTMRIVVPSRHESHERILQIVSVLNIEERDDEVQIMAQEVAA